MPASDPTVVPHGVPEDAVDELYGLPIDEFTTRRDALVAELRSAGKRDPAAWAKALRKPTAAAWIVNQLARTRAREAKELLSAGDELRTAHERLVAGEGTPDDLRAASEREQTAAGALLADAGGFLDRDGHAPSDATLEKVAQTIRAVALDDEARAGFEHARMTRERTAAGFGPVAGAVASPRRKGGRAKPGTTARRSAAARDALKKARAGQRERARALEAAEGELTAAEREAEQAARRLKRARADADKARSQLADAESRLAELEKSSPGGD
jgi:hypothetical protein